MLTIFRISFKLTINITWVFSRVCHVQIKFILGPSLLDCKSQLNYLWGRLSPGRIVSGADCLGAYCLRGSLSPGRIVLGHIVSGRIVSGHHVPPPQLSISKGLGVAKLGKYEKYIENQRLKNTSIVLQISPQQKL